ncbi:hypothetical protein F2P81_020719 [Scophthalmus maximus]|uniref:Uncharacterized protein n=1 Tax=Scophthalmus maximus TaxID=52904 RepID=A0A6A4S6Z1_SCOMX|nr:hypothetical protein F2P81_020719 [Scophthalmus maximus]
MDASFREDENASCGRRERVRERTTTSGADGCRVLVRKTNTRRATVADRKRTYYHIFNIIMYRHVSYCEPVGWWRKRGSTGSAWSSGSEEPPQIPQKRRRAAAYTLYFYFLFYFKQFSPYYPGRLFPIRRDRRIHQ